MNKSSDWFKISGVLAMIFGIIACITIVGALIGVPLLFASINFFKFDKLNDQELYEQKSNVILWGVIFSIFCFPLGLISLIPLFSIDGAVKNIKDNVVEKIENISNPKSKVDEKIEKIKELNELKEKGIIDEKDFQLAKEKLINDL